MVITDINQVVYQGDGINTAWPFAFEITDATEIRVQLNNADGTAVLVNKDFYVDMNTKTVYYPGYAPGAEPPEISQPPKVQAGQTITVYREIPLTQEVNLGNKWPFYVIEYALDKLTMIAQQIYSGTNRKLDAALASMFQLAGIVTDNGKLQHITDQYNAIDANAAAAAESEENAAASATAAANSASSASASNTSATNTANALINFLGTKETLTAPAVDPTLTISGAAADAQVTGDWLGVISDEVLSASEMQVSTSANGWRLVPTTGLSANNSDYKLVKYAVTAGKSYKVVSDDYFQFQSVASVPATGTSNRIGDTYGAGTFYVTAPTGATYLIFSTPTTDSTAKAYEVAMVVDPIFNDISEKWNWFDPNATYKFVGSDGTTSRDRFVTNNGDGSFLCKGSNGATGQIIALSQSGETIKAGTYTLSARISLNDNLPETTAVKRALLKVGMSTTPVRSPIATEWGGDDYIDGTTTKVGYVHATFTLDSDSPMAFMVEVDSSALGSESYPYTVDMIQIEAATTVSAYDPRMFTAIDKIARNEISKTPIAEIKTALYNDNRIMYTTYTARHSYATATGGKVIFHVGARLNSRLSSDNSGSAALAWEDISSDISDAIVIDGNEADITINAYYSLVYNTTDRLLHLRNLTNNTADHMDDILLVANTFWNPVKGVLWDEYIDRKVIDDGGSGDVTSDQILVQSFNSAYHVGATDFANKCEEFSALLCGTTDGDYVAPTDFESFLFFTDPHLTQFSNWQNLCYEYIAQIQKYYNSTPTTFCLCGGDWLGNSDLPATASFKLGYIDGFMHSMFDNCYMLVGNHDTNYQGKKDAESATYTTRLTNQSIADLWFRKNGKAYFSFEGAKTNFYCFDTGIEGQSLDSFEGYGWEQAQWFANALLTDNHSHIAIVAHILYNTIASMVIHPLADKVLEIAEAYNARTTINVNGTSYDYSGKTGKVDYALFGHTHDDYTFTIHNIPCVITTWVRAGSNSPTFDLVLADYDARKLKFIRVGSGVNRTVEMSQ